TAAAHRVHQHAIRQRLLADVREEPGDQYLLKTGLAGDRTFGQEQPEDAHGLGLPGVDCPVAAVVSASGEAPAVPVKVLPQPHLPPNRSIRSWQLSARKR